MSRFGVLSFRREINNPSAEVKLKGKKWIGVSNKSIQF